MSELFTSHMNETKKVLLEKANGILLNDDDLELDKKVFAPLSQKMNNMVLMSYLQEYANGRLEDFGNLCNNESLVDKYRTELVEILRDIIRKDV